jgi:hypothetical protein
MDLKTSKLTITMIKMEDDDKDNDDYSLQFKFCGNSVVNIPLELVEGGSASLLQECKTLYCHIEKKNSYAIHIQPFASNTGLSLFWNPANNEFRSSMDIHGVSCDIVHSNVDQQEFLTNLKHIIDTWPVDDVNILFD